MVAKMLPYISILVFVALMAYLTRISRSVALRRFGLIVIFLGLVLFAGLRSSSVGTDTEIYVAKLDRITSVQDIWRTTEIGYNSLTWLSAFVSDGYFLLLVSISFVVVLCYMVTIVRLNERYETGLFLFLTLGVYTFFFNGARQGIASALCFFALPFLLERRPIPYFLLIACAALFHHTALVAVPLYFVASSRVGLKQLFIVGASAMLAVLFLSNFVTLAAELLDEKYATYAEQGEGGGRIMTAFLVAQGVALLLFKRVVEDSDCHFGRLLNIYLVGLIPVIAAVVSNVNPSGILRLHVYFSHVALLLWPMVFYRLGDNPVRHLMAMGFVFVTILYFLLTTSSFSQLAPYKVNPGFAW